MAGYTFKPNSNSQFVNWGDPAVWTNGVVPNSPDADVDFPTVTDTATGNIYTSFVQISAGDSFTARSVDLRDYLIVYGSLSVGGALKQYSGGEIDMHGGTISAGSITNDGIDIQGAGLVTAGTLTNNTLIVGSGLTINAVTLVNNGTLTAASGTLIVNVGTGGFAGLSAGTLSSGSYEALSSSALLINAGSVVSMDAATITLRGGSFASHDPASGRDIALTDSLRTIAPSGTLVVGGNYHFQQLTVEGALTLQETGRLTADQLVVAAGGHLQGDGTIGSAVDNDGVITAGDFSHSASMISTHLLLNGAITGDGYLEISAGKVPQHKFDFGYAATLEINGPTSQNVIFDNGVGTLVLDQPSAFKGAIATVGAGDNIILSGLSLQSVTNASYSGDVSGGTLTLQQTGGTTTLHFLGNYSLSSFTFAAGPQALSSDPPSLLITAAPHTQADTDFNGDGASDILWRNTDGGLSTWQAIGSTGQMQQAAFNARVGIDWRAVETFDMNGDGHADILWRNIDGSVAVWTQVADHSIVSSFEARPVGGGWQIAGTGDLNGDGRDDILWRNDDGSISVWSSTGSSFAQNSYYHSSVGTSWRVEGLADFNGDGRSDILWRHENGTISVWTSTGSAFAENTYNDSSVGRSWHIEGLADFNGDGRADILWRNDNGSISIWRSNGTGFDQSVYNDSSVGNDWHIASVGDYNGDGRADLLWHRDDGSVSTWQSNGGGFDQAIYNAGAATSWNIVSHDFPF
jgi:hypothetical protein